MTDQPDRRRALAFNAVGPAVNAAGCWLPLSARRAVADAVLEAIADSADGYCPHCGRGDAGPSPDAYEEMRQQAAQAKAALTEARSWARHGYEIGQRSCTWSDHGVAPAWLTGSPERHEETPDA
jgi:hypothetical protein